MGGESAIEELERWADESDEALRPLPAAVYTSLELLQLEIEKLFYKEWVCVGHVSELQKPGDYLTFDIVDKPVLIVCDEVGTIRAFSNVCRHRGTVLASGSGNCKLFSCPYHAWTYDLNGCLRTAPYMDKRKVQDVTLSEYCVEIWLGLVFVSLDKDAAPLAPRLAVLGKSISPYGFSDYQVIYREEGEIACNWKLLVENFCESYHVFNVHKNSFQSKIPATTTKVQQGGEGFNHHTQAYADLDGIPSSMVTRLPLELRDLGHLSCIYPCLALSVDVQVGTWLIVRPTGPQSLKYTAQLALPDGNGIELSEEFIDYHIDLFNQFMPEDKTIIELVQRGVAANVGNAGVLHPWEQTNWEFGHYLARQLTGLGKRNVALA